MTANPLLYTEWETVQKKLFPYSKITAYPAIFASDEFVRGHSFLGYKVKKYSEICEEFNDFNVVLAFASHIESVIENIKKINSEHKVFAPDVPVAGDGIFTRRYFEENREKFEEVYSHLADDESRRVYENIINFKISGKIDYLLNSTTDDKTSIYRDILKPLLIWAHMTAIQSKNSRILQIEITDIFMRLSLTKKTLKN